MHSLLSGGVWAQDYSEEDLTCSYVQTLFTISHFSYERVNELHSSVICVRCVTFVITVQHVDKV